MDWKLTDDEIREVNKTAADKWLEDTIDEPCESAGLAARELALVTHRAIADAAARKVDTELLEPWERGLKEQLQMPTASMSLVPCIEADYRSKLMVILSLRQALKQEVGL